MAETFGKTDKGDTERTFSNGYMVGCKFQSGSAGSLASISVYLKRWATAANVKCAITDTSFNLLTSGTTEEKELPDPQDGFLAFNFGVSKPEVLAETDYWLFFWVDYFVYSYESSGAPGQRSEGVETYGEWPDPIEPDYFYAFEHSIYATYVENQAPTAPTSLQVDGKSAPTGANCISDLTPGFTAIYNDPDAGDQSNAIQIWVGTASGLSDMWDSGWLADATIAGNRCAAKTYAGAALSAGTSYWWRCRFRDDDDAIGTWSAWQRFDICAVVPPVPPGIGLQCIPGGPLPHRRPFTLAVRLPKEEPSFPYGYSLLLNLLGG